jgi:hypothetical protein
MSYWMTENGNIKKFTLTPSHILEWLQSIRCKVGLTHDIGLVELARP